MSELYGLPHSVILRIHTAFQKYPHITKVILYGSRALGNFRKGSDIDLCIESSDMSLTELLALENELDELLLPWQIDLSLKNQIDNSDLITHIDAKGLQFYPTS